MKYVDLILKAPFTTAADSIHNKYVFIVFQRKKT